MEEKYQPQGVSLGFGCVHFDIVVHEIGHVIGFYHEHTRPDRDEYVEIKWENIQRVHRRNFAIQPSNTQGFTYDYESIMHYESDAYSKNEEDTIVSRQPKVTFSGTKLSPLDIAKANALYNCGE